MIYLDHHATTPVDPRVLEAMLPTFRDVFGNAASRGHAFGHRAKALVDEARAQVAALVGRRPSEVVFTSGATESDNLALKGVLRYRKQTDERDHLVVQVTEHKAVLDAATRLEREGVRVTRLRVDGEGRVDLAALREAIGPRTALVSLMSMNNEVGTVQPLAEVAELAHAAGAWLHCDAAQGAGYVPLEAADLISLNAHKIYGPKGVGALVVRGDGPRVRLIADIDGGGHERGMRSGTLNVSGIVGLGAACALMQAHGAEEAARLRGLAARLWAGLEAIGEVHLNGPPIGPGRHPGNVNAAFDFVDGEGLQLALAKHLAVSSGAACTSASIEPSYVLRAMGISVERASQSIRYGLGRSTTEEEIDRAIEVTRETVESLRAKNPLWRAHLAGETVDW